MTRLASRLVIRGDELKRTGTVATLANGIEQALAEAYGTVPEYELDAALNELAQWGGLAALANLGSVAVGRERGAA